MLIFICKINFFLSTFTTNSDLLPHWRLVIIRSWSSCLLYLHPPPTAFEDIVDRRHTRSYWHHTTVDTHSRCIFWRWLNDGTSSWNSFRGRVWFLCWSGQRAEFGGQRSTLGHIEGELWVGRRNCWLQHRDWGSHGNMTSGWGSGKETVSHVHRSGSGGSTMLLPPWWTRRVWLVRLPWRAGATEKRGRALLRWRRSRRTFRFITTITRRACSLREGGLGIWQICTCSHRSWRGIRWRYFPPLDLACPCITKAEWPGGGVGLLGRWLFIFLPKWLNIRAVATSMGVDHVNGARGREGAPLQTITGSAAIMLRSLSVAKSWWRCSWFGGWVGRRCGVVISGEIIVQYDDIIGDCLDTLPSMVVHCISISLLPLFLPRCLLWWPLLPHHSVQAGHCSSWGLLGHGDLWPIHGCWWLEESSTGLVESVCVSSHCLWWTISCYWAG